MKNSILWIFILFTSISLSQTKYFIYFKDKGVEPTVKLEKNSPVYNSALALLSTKSIARRIKNLGEENIITFEDLPIKEDYVIQLENNRN